MVVAGKIYRCNCENCVSIRRVRGAERKRKWRGTNFVRQFGQERVVVFGFFSGHG